MGTSVLHRTSSENNKPKAFSVEAGLAALRGHWPEYLMEAAELGAFMVSACFFTALIEHPASPVRQAVGAPLFRHALSGLAMGLTAVAIVYSPWGKRSGAHFNPVFTLTFFRLGKVAPWDAFFYVVAQCIGAVAGVVLSGAVLGMVIADPTVNYVVTVPGRDGAGVAFLAEFVISFGMMTTVLVVSNRRPEVARLTGLFAGMLVALYITFEAPLSGMSMNPARSFGSALPSGEWAGFWIYLSAPLLAMLAAAEVYVRSGRGHGVSCAKLHHQNDKRCIFCAYHGASAPPIAPVTLEHNNPTMRHQTTMNTLQSTLNYKRWATLSVTLVVLAAFAVTTGFTGPTPGREVRTSMFSGAKANTGYAIYTKDQGKNILTLSDDFVVPDTPAPHWQVVDSQGNVYLLQRLKIKDDKYNKTITVPAYVHDVAKVQIWCAWAEALLGEASFDKPVS